MIRAFTLLAAYMHAFDPGPARGLWLVTKALAMHTVRPAKLADILANESAAWAQVALILAILASLSFRLFSKRSKTIPR